MHLTLDDERLPNFLRGRRLEFAWEPHPAAHGLLYPDLVSAVQRACHRVHHCLGPGFFHQVCRLAAMVELRRSGLSYAYIKQLPVEYEGQRLGYQDVRLVRVEDRILLAAFALRGAGEARASALAEQLKARLRSMGLKLGLLANFHGTRLTMTPVRVT